MKKKSLSKKQKITVIIAVLSTCTMGTFGFIAIQKNINEQNLANNQLYDFYYIPEAEKIFINGKLMPVEEKDFYISAEQGQLNKLNVGDGDIVERGTLLYSCKNTQVINEIEDLKSQLSTKKKEKFNSVDAALTKSIDIQISELEQSISKLNKKAYSNVYASFSGKVYLNEKANSEIEQGAILSLKSTSFYMDGKINEYDLFKISKGQFVDVMIYSTKEKVSGEISFIGDVPYGDESEESLTEYNVKLDLEQQESFRNGLHVQGIVTYAQTELKLPNSAVVEEGGKSYVFIVDNGVATKKEVTVVEKTNEFYIVNEGIKQGTTLVRNAVGGGIEDGQNIYGNSTVQTTQGVITSE